MSKVAQHTTNISGSWEVVENVSLAPRLPKGVTLGLTSLPIVEENIKRRGLIIENGSAGTVFLGFGIDAELSKGVFLYPGGAFNMGEEDFYSGKIYGIATVVDSLVTVQEFS